MSKPLKYGLFLGVLGVIVGVLLALVNHITRPVIDRLELQKVKSELISVNSNYEWDQYFESKKPVEGVFVGKDGKQIKMYAFKNTTKGFKSGDIVTMTFIEDEKIVKVVILSMKDQTSGIGTKVEDEEYLKKFEGASINDYKNDDASSHTKNNIDVVAGATYTSRAIIDAVIKSSALYDKIVRG